MDVCFACRHKSVAELWNHSLPFVGRMKKQLHVYFGGTVQGVGFRFTAREIADDLGVCGWVKNMRDGKVEILAEADEKALQDFLDRINGYFGRYITGTDISWSPASGEFKDFEIAL
jgi:acylphosphatase